MNDRRKFSIIDRIKRGEGIKEAYISSEHICGFSILYPDLRAPKSLWLLSVGYGVPPRYKQKKISDNDEFKGQ